MCGIAGVVMLDSQSTAPVEQVREMLGTLHHRGPDDVGIVSANGFALGHRRLSIIDLSSGGHQPMESSDGRYLISYNGEIYNYLELRQELSAHTAFVTDSDTEVLLAAYRHWGERCFDRFNGMWALAIWDRHEQRMLLSRDRYGVKPLYYALVGGAVYFASEVKAIHRILPGRFGADRTSIYEYLVYNRTDQRQSTFVQGIRRLQHGSNAVIADGRFTESRWYRLEQNLGKPWESPEEYRSVFASAVGIRLRSDVPVGLCLSGGLDSSSIASSVVHDEGRRDLHTFSAVYRAGDTGDETEFIKLYDRELPTLEYIRPTAGSFLDDYANFLDCHFEPVGNLSVYSQYAVMKKAKESVTVLLDGQGNDEEMAGYRYFFGSYFKELFAKLRWLTLAKEASAYVYKHRDADAFLYWAYYSAPQFIQNAANRSRAPWVSPVLWVEQGGTSRLAQELFTPNTVNESLLQHFEYKLEHNLKWNDLNSMYFSLELRSPFLDYRVVESTIASPSSVKIRNGQTKWLLREAMRDVLPAAIQSRSDKVGFDNPADEWFRDPRIIPMVQDTLSSRALKESGTINLSECRKLYDRHLSNQVNAAREIWKWINLAHFLTTAG